MNRFTCFCLGALAGALATYAYREYRAAKELEALTFVFPDSPPDFLTRADELLGAGGLH